MKAVYAYITSKEATGCYTLFFSHNRLYNSGDSRPRFALSAHRNVSARRAAGWRRPEDALLLLKAAAADWLAGACGAHEYAGLSGHGYIMIILLTSSRESRRRPPHGAFSPFLTSPARRQRRTAATTTGPGWPPASRRAPNTKHVAPAFKSPT